MRPLRRLCAGGIVVLNDEDRGSRRLVIRSRRDPPAGGLATLTLAIVAGPVNEQYQHPEPLLLTRTSRFGAAGDAARGFCFEPR